MQVHGTRSDVFEVVASISLKPLLSSLRGQGDQGGVPLPGKKNISTFKTDEGSYRLISLTSIPRKLWAKSSWHPFPGTYWTG